VAPAISVVVPAYNTPPQRLAALYDSLRAQSLGDFEVILVDDASPHADFSLVTDPRFRVLRQEQNHGPAACRSAGAAAAQSPLLLFTDDDCTLAPRTLAEAVGTLAEETISVGNTITRTETRFGKAVALLGFPGGGLLGFDRVWRVDASGHARSFSSCNVAFRKQVFEDLGRFSEDFPVPGGEDTVLARRALEAGHAIRYTPEQVVYHVERGTWREFVRWQIVRGRGNYHIKQHVPKVGGYLRLRVWTFKNSLVQAGPLYAPWVLALIVASVYFQVRGFLMEKRRVEARRT